MHPVSAESTWIPDAPASNPIGYAVFPVAIALRSSKIPRWNLYGSSALGTKERISPWLSTH